MRPIIIRGLALIFFYLFLELLALVALTVADRTVGNPYRPNPSELNERQVNSLQALLKDPARSPVRSAQDPILGWKPWRESNPAGMRDNRSYQIDRNQKVLRVSAFGDSFTFSSDVSLEESWGQQLMTLNSSIQLFNFGAGAYGLDQAYLRYKQHKLPFKGDIVFIGYMSENIQRHVNVWRPFISPRYSNALFTKPRFKIIDDDLVLLPNPIATLDDHRKFLEHDKLIIPELGENDYHYNVGYNRSPLDFSPLVRVFKSLSGLIRMKLLTPIFDYSGMYSTSSEALELTERIFDEFYREVLADGSLPVILIFPDTGDARRNKEGKPPRYRPLLDYFDQKGYEYIDLQEAFNLVEKNYSSTELRVDWGHFSRLGNQIIAEHLEGYLDDRFALDPVNVSPAIQAERTQMRIEHADVVSK